MNNFTELVLEPEPGLLANRKASWLGAFDSSLLKPINVVFGEEFTVQAGDVKLRIVMNSTRSETGLLVIDDHARIDTPRTPDNLHVVRLGRNEPLEHDLGGDIQVSIGSLNAEGELEIKKIDDDNLPNINIGLFDPRIDIHSLEPTGTPAALVTTLGEIGGGMMIGYAHEIPRAKVTDVPITITKHTKCGTLTATVNSPILLSATPVHIVLSTRVDGKRVQKYVGELGDSPIRLENTFKEYHPDKGELVTEINHPVILGNERPMGVMREVGSDEICVTRVALDSRFTESAKITPTEGAPWVINVDNIGTSYVILCPEQRNGPPVNLQTTVNRARARMNVLKI